MRDEYEMELRIALAEGLLSAEEAEALREEALRLNRSPLELLRERGRLTEQTLASLRGGPPEEDSPAFPVPGWERYQCVRFLGQGGMGRVFLAHDPLLRRDVALKFVRDDDPELTRRFISEARAQARVNHERVGKVYEVGEVQGRAYIAMQYIDGQPLNLLARKLTPEQLAMVLRDAAEGVHAAHRAGLIHRDIKPSNILVARSEDGSLQPYVMDFGLARDWREGDTATGAVLGTPYYMAPEQARGEVSRLDRRADVYGLGATLYHLLTGVPPIPGSNALEVLNHIATVEPRPPRSLDAGIPADLEAIVLKCLEKERSARYDSARALAEDLERFLNGEPVRARPTGLGHRLLKKARRHRLVVGVAAAALLLVTLAVGQSLLTRRDAARREHLARRFTEQVEHIEALARYSGLSPLHDTRADRKALRARMTTLEAEIREAGKVALGPGHYALGQGFLALGEDAKAREHLETAWRHGFREPRVAYSLALILGRLYQEQLLEVERLKEPELRESRKRELEARLRDPALTYLRQSEGASVPSTLYVAALIAFYEERFDEALAHLDALGAELPWFHEAPKLRGDIHHARAFRHWNQGARELALADFEAGRRAYAQAASIGESVPEVHLALARLESDAMTLELYSQGDVHPAYNRGLAAASRASVADPEHPLPKVREAGLRRRLAEYLTNKGEAAEEHLEQAVAAARDAVALAPTERMPLLELGLSHWQWARYQQAHSQDPSEQLHRAIEAFERVAPGDRDYAFHTLLGLAFKVWADHEDQTGKDSLGHRSKAIASYLEAIQLDARLPEAWSNLGIAYLKRASHPRCEDPDGDLERARGALDRARTLNPKNVVPYFYGGQLHELRAQRHKEQGQKARPELDLAIGLYRKGLAINPKLAQLHNGLGSALLAQAKDAWERGEEPFTLLDEAQAAFEQARAVAPRQAFAYNNLGEVHVTRALYQRLRGENPAASTGSAVKAYQQALETTPGDSLFWANLAVAHHTQAEFELEHGLDPGQSLSRASEALQLSVKHNPNEARAWRYLGETRGLRARGRARRGQARAEDFEEAAHAFQKALELEPRRLEARIAYGLHLLSWASWLKQAGHSPGPTLNLSLNQAEWVLSARPQWPEARLLRASVLMALADEEPRAEEQRRQRKQALDEVREALAANPHLEYSWKHQHLRIQGLVSVSP